MTRVVYHGEHPNTEDPDTFVNRRHQISGGTDTCLSLRNYTETFMNNCYRRRQPFTYTLFRTDSHVASPSSTHCFRRDSNGRPPTLASYRDRTLSHPQNLSHICIPRGQFHNERHRRPARGPIVFLQINWRAGDRVNLERPEHMGKPQEDFLLREDDTGTKAASARVACG